MSGEHEGLYHVRQYRPAYFSGFEDGVVRDVPYDDILKAPWFRNFEFDGFERFSIEPYDGELVISAHYKDGERWVAGFAVGVSEELATNWRYAAPPKRSE